MSENRALLDRLSGEIIAAAADIPVDRNQRFLFVQRTLVDLAAVMGEPEIARNIASLTSMDVDDAGHLIRRAA